jgi:hypothetical protein
MFHPLILGALELFVGFGGREGVINGMARAA